MDLTSENSREWLPARLYFESGRPVVDWVFADGARLTEPFYDDTLEICQRRPFSMLFRPQTDLEDIANEIRERGEVVEPSGFIFHVSRCGSTLLSRMLAALDTNIVVSEASLVDKAIRGHSSEAHRIEWLRAVVACLGRRRFAEERRLFIKFDSWTSLEIALVKKAFPSTPWVFLYRNPLEVIVSNLREPGAQMIPGAIEGIFPGSNLAEILRYPTEERYARTIAAFCRSALAEANDPMGLLLNYEQLPEAMFDEVAQRFGMKLRPEEILKMREATRVHSKTGQSGFTPDGPRKRTAASEAATRFAGELVDPLYAVLEEMRTASRPNRGIEAP